MKKRFVETPTFTEWVSQNPPSWDVEFAELQKRLMDDPDQGRVMKACNGLRKMRIPDPKRGKGTRGGARVIYLHIPEVDWIYLLDIYDKDEKEDLSKTERRILAAIADSVRKEAMSTRLYDAEVDEQ